MTPIASASSVPPHIHPPIAHVPSAMRETANGAARYAISALSGLISEVITFLLWEPANVAPRAQSSRERSGLRNRKQHIADLKALSGVRLFALGSGKQHVGLLQPTLGLKP